MSTVLHTCQHSRPIKWVKHVTCRCVSYTHACTTKLPIYAYPLSENRAEFRATRSKRMHVQACPKCPPRAFKKSEKSTLLQVIISGYMKSGYASIGNSMLYSVVSIILAKITPTWSYLGKCPCLTWGLTDGLSAVSMIPRPVTSSYYQIHVT
jgi:hypothetical protein